MPRDKRGSLSEQTQHKCEVDHCFYKIYIAKAEFSTQLLFAKLDNHVSIKMNFSNCVLYKKSAMAKDLTVLTNEIRRYAESRTHDVSRGAETPALAALMVEKFGEGLVKAGYLLGLECSAELEHEISRLIREIDPYYPTHLQYRFEARPAGLAIGGAVH